MSQYEFKATVGIRSSSHLIFSLIIVYILSEAHHLSCSFHLFVLNWKSILNEAELMFLGFVYNNSFLNVSASVIIVMTRVHTTANYFINIFHFSGPRINFIRFSSKLKDNKTQTLFLVTRVDSKYLDVVFSK